MTQPVLPEGTPAGGQPVTTPGQDTSAVPYPSVPSPSLGPPSAASPSVPSAPRVAAAGTQPAGSRPAQPPDPDPDAPASAPAPEEPAQGSADGAQSGAGAAVLSFLSAAREVLVVLVIALALAALIKTFLVQAFFIPSDSMQHTLERGDRVLVSKLTPGPFALHRGDVVVFKDPGGWLTEHPFDSAPSGVRGAVRTGLTFVGLLPSDSGQHLIKRVIGLPGDHVTCCTQGKVVVNGVPITEPYLFPGNQPSDKTFDIRVPPGRIWVMGDHREVSQDSRFHQDTEGGGTVPMSDVVGRAFVIVWPLDRATVLHNPSATFADVPAP